MVAAVDMTQVLVALIAAVPAIIAAIYGVRATKALKTPNGKTVGQLTAENHDSHTATNEALNTLVRNASRFPNGTGR